MKTFQWKRSEVMKQIFHWKRTDFRNGARRSHECVEELIIKEVITSQYLPKVAESLKERLKATRVQVQFSKDNQANATTQDPQKP